jgi:hypothetical protein
VEPKNSIATLALTNRKRKKKRKETNKKIGLQPFVHKCNFNQPTDLCV